MGWFPPTQNLFLIFYKLYNIQQLLKKEKHKYGFRILLILGIFIVCLTKFKSYQILLNKISLYFLVRTNQKGVTFEFIPMKWWAINVKY